MDKALVALPEKVWDIIDHEIEAVYGTGRSDKVRAIVIACLSEQGYLAKGGKEDAKDG